MPANSIMIDIANELKRAKRKHPNWPDHIVARAGIVCEEAGELMKSCLQFKYENGGEMLNEVRIQNMREEAIQTAAMAIRFLESLDSNPPVSLIQKSKTGRSLSIPQTGNL